MYKKNRQVVPKLRRPIEKLLESTGCVRYPIHTARRAGDWPLGGGLL